VNLFFLKVKGLDLKAEPHTLEVCRVPLVTACRLSTMKGYDLILYPEIAASSGHAVSR